MKNTLKLIKMVSTTLLLLFTIVAVNGQSKSKFPHTGVQSANGCLACPGSEWNSATDITKKDGQFATTTMSQKEYCFMTNCFYTRGLIGSNFGFNLPATATVSGIALRINRKSDIGHAVKDSAVQLMKGYAFVGENKKANSFWPTNAHNKAYGGSTDLWGTTWTPDEINSDDFQVWLKAYNKSDGYPTASVDYFRITVYYADGFAKKSQTAEFDLTGNVLKVYPNPATEQATLSIAVPQKGNMNIVMLNAMGAQVLELKEAVDAGNFTKIINLGNLPVGNYFVRCSMNGKTWITGLVKE